MPEIQPTIKAPVTPDPVGGVIRLNPEQQRAVEHGDGPLLIIAGAGTGKTAVIVERMAWLMTQQRIRPDEILCLTFTDKAANEMTERVDRRLPYGYIDLWVSTFHGFGERILREHAIDIGLPGDFKLLNERQQWLFMRQHLEEFPLNYYRPLGRPTKFIKALIQHFSRCKDEAVTPREYLEYVEGLRLDRDAVDGPAQIQADDEVMDLERLTELAQSYDLYTRLMREAGFFDFGDLIIETMRLFKERPGVLARYQEQFRYILVDEFQDTNWAQYELIKLLTRPRNNLTVVGDDDQSIYKFRGASVSNILEFKQDFPNSTSVVLTTNYRSTQNILDTAYGFIQGNNPNRLEAQLTNDKDPNSPKLTKRLVAAKTEMGQVETIVGDTESDEVRLVIADILKRKNSGPGIAWSDCAILVRANDHAELFLSELERNGIPYHYLASRGLYRMPIVLDILAYLRLLDDYHESIALQRMFNLPMFRFTAEDVMTVNGEAKKQSQSVFSVLRNHAVLSGLTHQAHEDADRLLRLIGEHSEQARRQTVREIIMDFLSDSGYLRYLSEAPDDPERELQISYANQFLKEVVEFERGSLDRSVAAFMHTTELAIESGELGQLDMAIDEGPDAVKIMTVHAAKGLEYRFVYVVNLVERRFPSTERSEPIPLPDALVRETIPQGDIHLEEERRLFYVALTRAKQVVTLSRALDYGGVKKKKPSIFLEELGLVTKESARDERKVQPTLLTLTERIKQQPEPEAILRKVANEQKFDYSRLSTYEMCPWKFRYRYVLDVPVPGHERFSFGSSVHAALYEFFHLIQQRTDRPQGTLFSDAKKVDPDKPLVSLEEFQDIYERAWNREWYESEAAMLKQKAEGWTQLKTYYESHDGKFPVPFALEKPFTLKFDDSVIIGKIDRIDRIPGDSQNSVEIFDYKTGTAKEKPPKDRWYQLLLYALAVRDPNVLNERVGRITFLYLNGNVRVSKTPTEKDYAEANDWALKSIAAIRTGQFAPDPDQFKCPSCEFNRICPFRAGRK